MWRVLTLKWSVFVELTEIYTFIGNVFLGLIGIAYSVYVNQSFHLLHTLVYMLAIFCFHVFANAFNNLKDYHNASDAHNYKETSNTIGRYQLPLRLVEMTCLIAIVLFLMCGAYFFFQHHWLLMAVGVIGFGVGVLYSSGPAPLNSLPVSEIIAAGAMGYLVPLGAFLANQTVAGIDFSVLVNLLLICVVPVMTMFNCLLANNTCDLEEDIVNGRKTLVYYLDKPLAVRFFQLVCVLMFVVPFFLLLTHRIAGLPALLIAYAPIAWRGLQPYYQNQLKRQTFPLVIHHMERTLHLYALLYACDVLLKLVM
ncbi:hypothetical protein CBF27_04425 [Vagococcus acidifermentans]|uniref:Prenyltransferase n=1 Tax=Vagococcus acidifermentans TaxID=564710 RepID=A0A430AZE4_9ENTE|nr:hypothetical protein CBF27_04425 [Vagococcus acidifermentans]